MRWEFWGVAYGMTLLAVTPVEGAWDDAPEIKTASFIVKTNLSEDLADALLPEVDGLLDRTEGALREIVDLSPRGPHKFRLLLFATMEAYRAYVSAIMTPSLRESFVEHSGGYFSDVRNEIVLSCPTGDAGDCRSGLVHEFTHALSGRSFFMAGGERVNWNQVMPAWLDEGLAEYLTMRIEPPRTPYWQTLKVAVTQNTLMPLGDLIDREKRPLDHPLFYPCAWALVAFLIDQDPSGSPKQMKAYLQLLKTTRFAADEVGQFETIFGKSQDVEAAWKQFIESAVDNAGIRRRRTR